MKKIGILSVLIFALMCFAGGTQVGAASITFTDYVKFAGGAASPSLSATIEDIAPDTVKITMKDLVGTDAEKVMSWWFNVDPFPAAGLSATYVSGQSANTVKLGLDVDQADGDGKYDVVFVYPKSGDTFNPGETSIYTLSGTGLDATDFIALSAPGGGKGPYYSAVEQSSWWGQGTKPDLPPPPVPEPATMLVVGLGLVGLAGVRRKLQN